MCVRFISVGRSACARNWNPHAETNTTSARHAALAERIPRPAGSFATLNGHDVDQPAGHDDQLAHLLSIDETSHVLVAQRRLFDRRAVASRRYFDMSTQFAVDLHH